MISKYAKFEYNDIKIEANYNKESTPCKKIKITVKGKSSELLINDLYALMVLFANDEQMAECTAVKPFKTIRKIIKVKAKKDFKKGDDIVFPIAYEVSPEVFDAWEEQQKDRVIKKDKAEKLVNNIFKNHKVPPSPEVK